MPIELRPGLGEWVFGCDVCQEVCPWNASPVSVADAAWSSRDDVNLSSLIDLWRRTDEELAALIGDTAMTRAGVRGLRRNVAVALGNSGDPQALEALMEPPDSATKGDAVVAEHVQWAKDKLATFTQQERS